jgi:hypothetical protein
LTEKIETEEARVTSYLRGGEGRERSMQHTPEASGGVDGEEGDLVDLGAEDGELGGAGEEGAATTEGDGARWCDGGRRGEVVRCRATGRATATEGDEAR